MIIIVILAHMAHGRNIYRYDNVVQIGGQALADPDTELSGKNEAEVTEFLLKKGFRPYSRCYSEHFLDDTTKVVPMTLEIAFSKE